ncbi:MAG: dinitrogenase iron-molybdenum cofactor biosynthesis protein [Methanobrevibacter sp.]|jgi:predicted Fe-Mo cluster-binding NifX family protein|nr:dinitrogenase iron-molybdenum cofactor biosynthesis protein [Methanobrevibacter sp.]
MTYRVAVTSDDGEYVNQHFGKASHFLIFEIDDNNEYEYLGAVNNNPICGSDRKNKSANSVSLISDVSILITRNVGIKPTQILIENGIKPYLTSAAIETALEEVMAMEKKNKEK